MLELINSDLLSRHLLCGLQQLILKQLDLTIRVVLLTYLSGHLSLPRDIVKLVLESLDGGIFLYHLLLQEFIRGLGSTQVAALKQELNLADCDFGNLLEGSGGFLQLGEGILVHRTKYHIQEALLHFNSTRECLKPVSDYIKSYIFERLGVVKRPLSSSGHCAESLIRRARV